MSRCLLKWSNMHNSLSRLGAAAVALSGLTTLAENDRSVPSLAHWRFSPRGSCLTLGAGDLIRTHRTPSFFTQTPRSAQILNVCSKDGLPGGLPRRGLVGTALVQLSGRLLASFPPDRDPYKRRDEQHREQQQQPDHGYVSSLLYAWVWQ